MKAISRHTEGIGKAYDQATGMTKISRGGGYFRKFFGQGGGYFTGSFEIWPEVAFFSLIKP